MAKITIDGTEYETEALSENGKAQVASLQFLQSHMQQLRNEIAVLETAKRSYQRALKTELAKDATKDDATEAES